MSGDKVYFCPLLLIIECIVKGFLLMVAGGGICLSLVTLPSIRRLI